LLAVWQKLVRQARCAVSAEHMVALLPPLPPTLLAPASLEPALGQPCRVPQVGPQLAAMSARPSNPAAANGTTNLAITRRS
jgi:hypothetical protein